MSAPTFASALIDATCSECGGVGSHRSTCLTGHRAEALAETPACAHEREGFNSYGAPVCVGCRGLLDGKSLLRFQGEAIYLDADEPIWTEPPKRGQPVGDPTKPRHYKDLSPEPIDVIAAWGLGFNLGCVVKYVARADLKGVPLVDLAKAKAYLEHEISLRTRAGK